LAQHFGAEGQGCLFDEYTHADGSADEIHWGSEMILSAFSFEGRINRARFWKYVLAMGLMFFVFDLGVLVLGGHGLLSPRHPDPIKWAVIPTFLVLFAIATWVMTAAGARRFRDRNKSGWWVLIGFVPVIGAPWYWIECGFLPGTIGSNKYGPDPLA
jgi:uncharacterized membrane protein YhaH (DUF805 family)